mmetsp:Transcript_37584/g.57290  ORF Transcript_37584/g.57290 Transcript_37584/m.57290 type:complete len:400 (+) Transcript_37584:124-1323(+)
MILVRPQISYCSMMSLASFMIFLVLCSNTIAYNPIPNLSHKEMVGIWRLTLKEYFLPRIRSVQSDPQKSDMEIDSSFKLKKKKQDLLLMLREDRTFVYYGRVERISEGEDEDNNDGKESRGETVTTNSEPEEIGKGDGFGNIMNLDTLQGIWDYRDGGIILAADRPPNSDIRKVHDTILVGKVIARINDKSQSLSDNPNLPKPSSIRDDFNQNLPPSTSNGDPESNDNEADINLAILDGEISIGKFTYPKQHPSFFEQPMLFRSAVMGTCQLYQTLGSIKIRPRRTDKKKIERFKREEFYGKKFLLTTMPVDPKRGMPKLVWKRSEGKYIDEKKYEDPDRNIDIRVMPIEFYANNTFCAVGSNKILRGRFEITGDEKDRIEFAVSLFGAGRSVSGSIYR